MLITFYELLGMIRNGTQPKKIKLNDRVFEWDEIYSSYRSDYSFLTVYLGYSTTDEQIANSECIEIEDEQHE